VEEEFEDTKRIIRRRNSKKDRKFNDQMKNDKRTSNYLQNITQKIADRTTRAPLKAGRWSQVLQKG